MTRQHFALIFLLLMPFHAHGLRLLPSFGKGSPLPEMNNDEIDLITDMVSAEVVPSAAYLPESRPNFPVKHPNPKRWWIFGAHHKSGTHLMRNLAGYQASAVKAGECVTGGCGRIGACSRNFESHGSQDSSVWFACGFQASQMVSMQKLVASEKNVDLRVVHIIREPIAIVVSGYLYHMHSNDHGPSRTMRDMNLQDAIVLEAEWALNNTLSEMLEMYNFGKNYPGVLTVRMEDFIKSSKDFDNTVSTLYEHSNSGFMTPSELANLKEKGTLQDLGRHPGTDAAHQASAYLKKIATDAMRKIPSNLLRQLQTVGKQLGYVYDSKLYERK